MMICFSGNADICRGNSQATQQYIESLKLALFIPSAALKCYNHNYDPIIYNTLFWKGSFLLLFISVYLYTEYYDVNTVCSVKLFYFY